LQVDSTYVTRRYIIKPHKDLSELKVAIVGRTALSVSVATALVRAGCKWITFFETEESSVEDIPGVLRMDVIKRMLKKIDAGLMIEDENLDLNQNQKRTDTQTAKFKQEYEEKVAPATFVILCDPGKGSEVCVRELAAKNNIPWMIAGFSELKVSFHFQFYTNEVISVLPNDVVIGPFHNHIDGVQKQLLNEGTVWPWVALSVSSTATFAGIVASNIVKFWTGSVNVQGYLWYSPVYNKFSALQIKELRAKMTANIGT